MAQQPDAAVAAQQSPQPPTTPLPLTEDEADDLLYCARTGDLDELQAAVAAAVARVGTAGDDDSETMLRVLAAARDASQNTPLHMAAANGHAEVVQYLLKVASAATTGQAFVDAANAFGNTALHWAALNGRLAVVRRLVEGPPRCAVALANDKNYIALDLASLHGHGAVAAYFMAEAEGRQGKGGGKKGEEEEEDKDKEDGADKDDKDTTSGLSTATAALALEP